MLSARGVSRASAILPSFHLKQFITFTNPVLIHKFLQCEILQRVLHGKSAFSGLTLSYEAAAQALNVGLPTLKTLIHRLRRRHTQFLREEVARTVINPNDVDAEVHALCEALVQAQGRVHS